MTTKIKNETIDLKDTLAGFGFGLLFSSHYLIGISIIALVFITVIEEADRRKEKEAEMKKCKKKQ